MLASVLVPVLNEEQHVREAVAAMKRQRLDGGIEFLFVDGRSEDQTREILLELGREDPRIRVLDNPARRTPQALNIALRAARGEYVVRMDAHTIYPSDYVAAGIERLVRGDVAWVTGPQLPRGRGTWSRRVALALSSPFGTGGSRKWGNASGDEVDLDTGVFTGVWRRETLERLGGWDEDWPVNQDSELAARIQEEGGRIVCLRQMAAEYIPRDSVSDLARQYWRFGLYRAKTSHRHPASMRRSHLLAPALALTALTAAAAPRLLAKPARAALLGYAGVLATISARAHGDQRAERSDALALPAVFSTMHLSFGFGFLWGCLRFGPPLRSLRGMLRPRTR